VAERLARQQLGLDAALGADQHRLDARVRLAQRLSQREGGDEMAAGTAAGEENPHPHPGPTRNAERGTRN